MKANDAILKNMQTNMTSLTNSNLELKNMFGQFMKMNTASSSGSRTLPSNTITNSKEDLKGIRTRRGTAYQGPTISTTSSLPKVVERETEVTKDTMPPTNNGSTKDVQPPVVQIETPEQWAYLSTHPSKHLTSFCYDDDEDYTFAITPNEPILSTEEPDNSLSMGDEHLDTIPATKSDEFIKSSVENLIPIPSESEGIPEHMCDVPSHDNSPPLDVSKDQFEDFFESNEEFSSIDDDSFSFDNIDYVEASPPDYELVSSEGDMLLLEAFLNDDHSSDFKTKSFITSLNSLLEETNNFDNSLPEFTTFSKEEIIPMKSFLEEFAGELTLLKSIPSGIDETDCDFEEDIRSIEKLLYDNSSPRPPEEFVSVNSDAESESFSPSPILVKDNDSLMEEIDLFCTLDYPMPSGIVDKDYDSERDILIPKDLPSNNTISFSKKESLHFDIPPFSRPLAKPPYGDTGILNIKMMRERIPKKDKIRSKSDKNGKRGEAGKSQKQLQWIKQEKLKKTQKEGPN
uniref:Reverse transcriptase domain-containing protein n=1 Tax=Tanacetum cinerariifolium TaxID=118510 RepID=A0A6L2KE52_TANCI|nr:reverse transcriptase domain-containing protein [Tanacetum cinerariifolium]